MATIGTNQKFRPTFLACRSGKGSNHSPILPFTRPLDTRAEGKRQRFIQVEEETRCSRLRHGETRGKLRGGRSVSHLREAGGGRGLFEHIGAGTFEDRNL